MLVIYIIVIDLLMESSFIISWGEGITKSRTNLTGSDLFFKFQI